MMRSYGQVETARPCLPPCQCGCSAEGRGVPAGWYSLWPRAPVASSRAPALATPPVRCGAEWDRQAERDLHLGRLSWSRWDTLSGLCFRIRSWKFFSNPLGSPPPVFTLSTLGFAEAWATSVSDRGKGDPHGIPVQYLRACCLSAGRAHRDTGVTGSVKLCCPSHPDWPEPPASLSRCSRPRLSSRPAVPPSPSSVPAAENSPSPEQHFC